jgi:hypothetical protein
MLQREQEFKVLAVASGKAADLVSELRKLGSKQVAVIVIAGR